MATLELVERLRTATDALATIKSLIAFTDRSLADFSLVLGTANRGLANTGALSVTPGSPVIVGAPLSQPTSDLGWRLLQEHSVEFDRVERVADGVSWSVHAQAPEPHGEGAYFQVHLFIDRDSEGSWARKDRLFALFAADSVAAKAPPDEFQLELGRIAWKLKVTDLETVRRLDAIVCETMSLQYAAFAFAMTVADFAEHRDEALLARLVSWDSVPEEWRKHRWSDFAMPFQIGAQNRTANASLRPDHLERLLNSVAQGDFSRFLIRCRNVLWRTARGAESEKSLYNGITLGAETPRRDRPQTQTGFWLFATVDTASDGDSLVLGEDDRRQRSFVRELKSDLQTALAAKLRIRY